MSSKSLSDSPPNLVPQNPPKKFIGKDGKIVMDNSKGECKKRSKKEMLIEFKMMLKELREEFFLLLKDESQKSEVLKNLTQKKTQLVNIYTERMLEIRSGMEDIRKD